METKKPKFEEGKEYLVINLTKDVYKIKMLKVTKTCYFIEWESSTKDWYTIENFEYYYDKLEELVV